MRHSRRLGRPAGRERGGTHRRRPARNLGPMSARSRPDPGTPLAPVRTLSCTTTPSISTQLVSRTPAPSRQCGPTADFFTCERGPSSTEPPARARRRGRQCGGGCGRGCGGGCGEGAGEGARLASRALLVDVARREVSLAEGLGRLGGLVEGRCAALADVEVGLPRGVRAGGGGLAGGRRAAGPLREQVPQPVGGRGGQTRGEVGRHGEMWGGRSLHVGGDGASSHAVVAVVRDDVAAAADGAGEACGGGGGGGHGGGLRRRGSHRIESKVIWRRRTWRLPAAAAPRPAAAGGWPGRGTASGRGRGGARTLQTRSAACGRAPARKQGGRGGRARWAGAVGGRSGGGRRARGREAKVGAALLRRAGCLASSTQCAKR